MVRKQMVGVVVSDKMNKTINVAVRLERTHPKYGVKIRDTRKYMAHDEAEAAKVGDVVRIEEGRKRSKHKAFELREIIRSAPRFGTTPLREGTGFAAGRLVTNTPAGEAAAAAEGREDPDEITPEMIAAATQRLKEGLLEQAGEAGAAGAHSDSWDWARRQRAEGLQGMSRYDEAVAAARAALGEGADGTKPVATGVGGDAPDAPEDDGFLDERIDDGTR